jgi:hypothetical protein
MLGDTMEFTFYGDLLGISGLYKLSPRLAYEKLNEFYNTTFFNFNLDWINQCDGKIMMFSDNFFMWGNDAEGALQQLAILYTSLLHRGLLLRGAIVKGKLEFDPRLERNDFQKYLPKDDTLARAVGLESTHKGARLLIEIPLANDLLESAPQWATAHGYIKNTCPRNPRIPYESMLRRIAPAPEGYCYELLYFWGFHRELNDEDCDYEAKRQELEEVHRMLKKDVGVHYKETISLLKRCQSRHAYTNKKMP